MPSYEPNCITIAGYDPSGGAGVLTDSKTFESIGVAACAVQTCVTFQNDVEFDGVQWTDEESIGRQFNTLIRRFQFSYAKIGLIRDIKQLVFIIRLLENHNPDIRIVLDPIRKASAGFDFGRKEMLEEYVLKKLYLITPNLDETGIFGQLSPEENCKRAAQFINVFLKDGHGKGDTAVDRLFMKTGTMEFPANRLANISKHGSGCVLSSAITAYLSLGHDLIEACSLGKEYTRQFLLSSDGLLGKHRLPILNKEEVHV
jgi:hydroxymethylpyrimidine/phosphomethylpyrimidine kinase